MKLSKSAMLALSKANAGHALVDANLYRDLDKIALDMRCPICEGPVKRKSRRDDGGIFFGCNNYPDCKGLIPVSPWDADLECLKRKLDAMNDAVNAKLDVILAAI